MTVPSPVISRRFYMTDGQFIITTVPTNIHTVLGSCVSVCLWDKKLKIGGMNHYLMPGSPASAADNSNHGYTSIRVLINSMVNRGARAESLEAKIFGGCNSWLNKSDWFSVGFRNIEMAEQMLRQRAIPITARDTGGIYGRKIIFNTSTGKVKVYVLSKTAIVVNEEINKGFGY